ncbi:hypothetical protein OIDMADRAFT_20683 [Oidiodendron maius Zn]|uniref:Uncharacterized protein n=1 Tax=Oidiodendron maius (strain Zn) TaxID=913774 RepID=A0A0C3H0K1_OIDMZ|nr:hypothetical protein OIDMADRAFT_20683 [Oidiodendron maius Zn]
MPPQRTVLGSIDPNRTRVLYEGPLPKTIHDQKDSQQRSQDVLQRIRYKTSD